ncbi:class I SAM-dependent methyltransferase [Methylocystis rosea]|uniref:class I SAM-dependent methyltransferase n=1 Tax=Methylocystis rosea TaxID=173366 RepID=UPI000369AE8B|nr:class I SAM-dependent methyltransferase [Methylocystis rosea]
MLPPAKALFNLADDEAWLKVLIDSVYEPNINGVAMPRFPHARTQEGWVGSSDEHALREGFNFYKYVKGYAEALGNPLHAGTQLLDFGCGWGRYMRLFWNDVAETGLHGVDIDSEILSLCRMLGVPGTYKLIEPRGALPFPDNSFDVVIAYSVFSHLPEPIATHWMSELSRVSRSGCVLAYTAEPRRFLQFISEIPERPESEWHAALSRFKPKVSELLREFDAGRFCYMPTSGGGDYMTADVYGDAAIPESFIKSQWEKYFRLWAYIDDPNQFWQALVIAQKA